MGKLPNKLEAEVIEAATWSGDYCYAREVKTRLHFYLKSPKLHEKLWESTKKRDFNNPIPIILQKKSYIIFNIYIAYVKNGNKVGKFSGPAGGGPHGNFYKDVRKAYLFS